MISFADLAAKNQRFVTASRMWVELLGNHPKLRLYTPGLNLRAAEAAIHAAEGKSKVETMPDEATKVTLRRHARTWLTADLRLYEGSLESGRVYRPQLVDYLLGWKRPQTLSSVSEPKSMATYPEAERKDWEKFWADVDAVLKAEERISALAPDDFTIIVCLSFRARDTAHLKPAEGEAADRAVLAKLRATRRYSQAEHRLGVDITPELAQFLEENGRAVVAEELLRESIPSFKNDIPGGPYGGRRFLRKALAEHTMRRSKWTQAEEVAREELAVQLRANSDYWFAFDAVGLVGAALLGQNKFAEAEHSLRHAYQRLDRHAKEFDSGLRVSIPATVKRLIHLYEETKNQAEAEKWQNVLKGEPPQENLWKRFDVDRDDLAVSDFVQGRDPTKQTSVKLRRF